VPQNIDRPTVEGFGREWQAYDQSALAEKEYREAFDAYFSVFPWDGLPKNAEGFDLGCGSGRWAADVINRVGILHCIDPAPGAIAVAKRRLANDKRAHFHVAGADQIPLADGSQDFGYSLGVLHHIPDTRRALSDCVRKLKLGAPFLVYLYYSFDTRPAWYRSLWRTSDVGRRAISRLPFAVRKAMTAFIAASIYWPMSKIALASEKLGADVTNFPLSHYRRTSFYTMRTDALDRFGTRLEQRFSRAEIGAMMHAAGLGGVVFREGAPYWIACGRRVA